MNPCTPSFAGAAWLKLQQNRWVNNWRNYITFSARRKASFSLPVDSIQHVFAVRGVRVDTVLFSLYALLIFCFHFSHLTSFSLTTLCTFSLSTAACNRLHAFAGSVRIGCLISACNVRVILGRKHDIFILFVRYCCCLSMLNCGKYFPPRATLFPGLNFILTFSPGWDDR